ncbi:MAG TPA: hypothetical protein VKD91_11815, partial [Pyrinomonadaceae bacterium]|nr:hypothetical protein [Pyrinomonadaceae bacterium]
MSFGINFKSAFVTLIICLSSLLLVGNIATAQTPSQPAATPAPVARRVTGPPFPPPQYIPPHNYDQRNIKLDLRFDWDKEQAIGSATITFAPAIRDVRRVEFDAAFLTVSGVTLANGTQLKFESDAARETLAVLLDRAYQPNE